MTSDVDACSRLVHDCSLYRAWQRGQGYGTEQITTPYTAAPKLDINHELLLLLPSNQALTGQSHCLSNLTSSTVGGSPGSSAAPKQSCGRKKKAPAVLRRRCSGSWATCGRLPNNQVWVFRVKLSNWNSKTKNVASTDISDINCTSGIDVGWPQIFRCSPFISFPRLASLALHPSEDILRPCFHWIRLETVDVCIQEPGANHHLPAEIIQHPQPPWNTPMALEAVGKPGFS